MPLFPAGAAPEIHRAFVVGEEPDGEETARGILHPQREQAVRLLQVREEQPRRIAREGRPAAFPAHEVQIEIVVLVGDVWVVRVLDHEAGRLRLADAVAARGLEAAPHRVFAAGERNQKCPVRHLLESRRLEQARREAGVLELDHRQPFGGGEAIERDEERGLIGVVIEERTHHVRAPAAQRRAQDPIGPHLQQAAAEVADRPIVCADRPAGAFDAATGRQVVEPHVAMEELAALVRCDQLVPAHDLGAAERVEPIRRRRRPRIERPRGHDAHARVSITRLL